jgi:hypothetical protein
MNLIASPEESVPFLQELSVLVREKFGFNLIKENDNFIVHRGYLLSCIQLRIR